MFAFNCVSVFWVADLCWLGFVVYLVVLHTYLLFSLFLSWRLFWEVVCV